MADVTEITGLPIPRSDGTGISLDAEKRPGRRTPLRSNEGTPRVGQRTSDLVVARARGRHPAQTSNRVERQVSRKNYNGFGQELRQASRRDRGN